MTIILTIIGIWIGGNMTVLAWLMWRYRDLPPIDEWTDAHYRRPNETETGSFQ